MKHYESPMVICPFYRCEEPKKIHCEGIAGASSSLQVFSDKESMLEYRGKYCEKDYKKCLIATGLDKKWP